MTQNSKRSSVLSGVSAFALAAMVALGGATVGSDLIFAPAYADDGGSGNASAGNGDGAGKGPSEGMGGSDGDHGSDHDHDDADHESDEEESDGKGPQSNKPEPGTSGGTPVWGNEGIPEVELGRLNVVRSPDHVLDAALAEALANLNDDMAVLYDMSLAEAVDWLANNWDEATMLDSPLQNLALLQDALDGSSVLNDHPLISNDVGTLEAIFLGIASDKTVPVTTDTVIAVTKILGFDLSAAEVADLAAEAEAIRQAVLEGHG